MEITKKTRKQLAEIAMKNIPTLRGRGDLERHYNDDEDFHDIAVWCLEDALIAAYELGRKDGKK